MENQTLTQLKLKMSRQNSKKIYSTNPEEKTFSFYDENGQWITRKERFEKEYTIEDIPQEYDATYTKARAAGIFLTIIANIPKRLKLTRIKELTPCIRNRFAGQNFDDRKFKMDLITKTTRVC